MLQKLFTSRKEWRNWLEKNHDKATEIWLIFYKVQTEKTSLKHEEAVEEALCFGWIDSTLRRIDDEKHMQRYTPRKAQSIWAASNKARVKKLIKAGLMTESGLKAVEIAKQNGSWNMLDAIETDLKIPQTLKQALKSNHQARTLFDGLSRSRKKQLIWWIESAKNIDTKAKRVKETVQLLVEKNGEQSYQ